MVWKEGGINAVVIQDVARRRGGELKKATAAFWPVCDEISATRKKKKKRNTWWKKEPRLGTQKTARDERGESV